MDDKIKLLIVDDSALVRKILRRIFADTPDIEVVGEAADAYIAQDKIEKLNPDVLTLDIEMPRMDGVTFLGKLMRLRPMPVVMVSSLTESGADTTLKALETGAVDFVSKPKFDFAKTLGEYSEELIRKVRTAARARVRPFESQQSRMRARLAAVAAGATADKLSADVVISPQPKPTRFRATDRIIGIGASTGGTEAIKDVLRELPPGMPGIVVSQHIPAAFSEPFAQRVNEITSLIVAEAEDGQQVLQGHVYIAPGDRHLLVERRGSQYVIHLHDGPPVNRHKPSVDVMMRSLAQSAGPNAIGLMLTGMGSDGAAGMGELKEVGGKVLVQDENSSVVWGMPGEVAKRGFADEVLPLNKLGHRLRVLAKL